MDGDQLIQTEAKSKQPKAEIARRILRPLDISHSKY
jgi:hypothetical protein